MVCLAATIEPDRGHRLECAKTTLRHRTPSKPRAVPNNAARDTRSRSHHAASGMTHIGVENASMEARPGGRMVNATAASAEYAAICSTPETATSGQSVRDGRTISRRTVTSANKHAAAMAYRKHAYQIGGTAATPILITGQLIAQLDITIPSSTRVRRFPLTPPCASAATPRP